MALRITDDCLNCFACISDCPNEAISEGAVIHVIDFSSRFALFRVRSPLLTESRLMSLPRPT